MQIAQVQEMIVDPLLVLEFLLVLISYLEGQRNKLQYQDQLLKLNTDPLLSPQLSSCGMSICSRVLATRFLPILHCDNTSTVNIAKNLVFHHRTKHIEIDVHFVREQVARGVIKLAPISGDDQIANIFT